MNRSAAYANVPERRPEVAEAAPKEERVLPAQMWRAQGGDCLAGGGGRKQPPERTAAFSRRDAASEDRVDCG